MTDPQGGIRSLAIAISRQLASPGGRVGAAVVPAVMNLLNRSMNRLALGEVGARPGFQILEIGFGGGLLLRLLLRAGATTVGIDSSPKMVRRMGRKLRAEIRAGQAAIQTANAERLPFCSASFDGVCVVNCHYFWADPSECLREIARVLLPGGALVLCFNRPGCVGRSVRSSSVFEEYDDLKLISLITAAGLRVSKVTRKRDFLQGEIICLRALKF